MKKFLTILSHIKWISDLVFTIMEKHPVIANAQETVTAEKAMSAGASASGSKNPTR